MSIPDKDYLPWIKLSTDRLQKELQAQKEFIPANKTYYPLELNIRKKPKLKSKGLKNQLKKFIPGKVFFPLNIDSSLSKYQQAICLKVLQMYRAERNFNNLTKTEQDHLNLYRQLQNVIQDEHVKFSEYVKKDWEKKSHRLEQMRNRLFFYTKNLWEEKLQKVLGYPSTYKYHDTVCLAYEDRDNHIQVSVQETVLNMGLPKTVVFPTLTSRCILNVMKLPDIKNYAVTSQMSVSQDNHIVQALETHDIDLVLSMSAIKRIMDDSNPNSFWNLPVVVKQRKVSLPNGSEQIRKVVFIDKTLPTQSPTKFEFNDQCHKLLTRTQFCRNFSGEETVESDSNESSNQNNENPPNVVYSIWNINFNDKENVMLKTKKQNKNISFLLRQKIDGYESLSHENKRPIVVAPKVEYQLEHGAGISTKGELIRQWADMFFRPFSHLYRVRLQANTSEVVDVESVCLQKINSEAMQHHQYKPYERLGALFTVFSKLLDLDCGHYMLHHNERTGVFIEILKECLDTDRDVKFDLSKTYDAKNCCVLVSKNKAWCPIDVNYILPVHKTYKRMPGMFKPLIIVHNKKGAKKKGKKMKKQKLKRKPT